MACVTPEGTVLLVRPQNGRGETAAFIAAVLLLIGSTVGYVSLHPRGSDKPKLTSWQVSSFDGLGAVDQAIFSALLPAVDEIIWNNNDTGDWYSTDQLQAIKLPPFFRDSFWKVNGELNWQAVLPGAVETTKATPAPAPSVAQEPDGSPPPPNAVFQGTLGQGATSYFGSGGKLPKQSAFLVVIGHAHSGVFWINQGTVWIHPNALAPFPKMTKTEVLIQEGWRQVVPYSGTTERERLKGTG